MDLRQLPKMFLREKFSHACENTDAIKIKNRCKYVVQSLKCVHLCWKTYLIAINALLLRAFSSVSMKMACPNKSRGLFTVRSCCATYLMVPSYRDAVGFARYAVNKEIKTKLVYR